MALMYRYEFVEHPFGVIYIMLSKDFITQSVERKRSFISNKKINVHIQTWTSKHVSGSEAKNKQTIDTRQNNDN